MAAINSAAMAAGKTNAKASATRGALLFQTSNSAGAPLAK
jgi:hypothetical protein